MAGRDERRLVRDGVEREVDHRREGRVGVLADEAVELRHALGRADLVERDRAHAVAELGHRRGRAHALADDVADDEAEAAVAQRDRVEPVAADVERRRAGQVAHGDLDALHRRQRLRQHAALQRLGDHPLRLVLARPVEREAALARQRLDEPPLALAEPQAVAPREDRRRRAAPRPRRSARPRTRGGPCAPPPPRARRCCVPPSLSPSR